MYHKITAYMSETTFEHKFLEPTFQKFAYFINGPNVRSHYDSSVTS